MIRVHEVVETLKSSEKTGALVAVTDGDCKCDEEDMWDDCLLMKSYYVRTLLLPSPYSYSPWI